MSDTLYNEVRPKLFKYLLGQENAVDQFKGMLANGGIPHALCLTGPSGVGKTTAAMILKNKMGCGDRDFRSINGADERGIGMVRGISEEIAMSPWCGKCRIYLIDEAHKLTNDAQNCLLGYLEFTPKHAYFILASSEPTRLIKAIQTRVTSIPFRPLTEEEIKKVVVQAVWSKFQKEDSGVISDEEIQSIAEAADGSARKALVILEQVLTIPPNKNKQRLEVIIKSDTKQQAMDLFKALMDLRTKWSEIQSIVNRIEDDPERLRIQLRAIVAGSAFKWKNLEKGKLGRMNMILQCFNDPMYDGKGALATALLAIFSS